MVGVLCPNFKTRTETLDRILESCHDNALKQLWIGIGTCLKDRAVKVILCLSIKVIK